MLMQPLLLLLPPASSKIAPAELELKTMQYAAQTAPNAATAVPATYDCIAATALIHHSLKAQQGQCVPQAAPEAATATCGCNRCCSCCCCCLGPAPTAAAASSLHAFSEASAAVGSGRVVKSGAMPKRSMSTPRGVRYFPTVMISPELSLNSYTD